MGKKRAKAKRDVTAPKSRDVLILTALILILLVVVFADGKGYLRGTVTGNFVQGANPILQDETWEIIECTIDSAQDAAEELHFTYGCGQNNCYHAAYGVTLPGNNVVQLNCQTNSQRARWVEWCDESFDEIC